VEAVVVGAETDLRLVVVAEVELASEIHAANQVASFLEVASILRASVENHVVAAVRMLVGQLRLGRAANKVHFLMAAQRGSHERLVLPMAFDRPAVGSVVCFSCLQARQLISHHCTGHVRLVSRRVLALVRNTKNFYKNFHFASKISFSELKNKHFQTIFCLWRCFA
jgi:hypothetical protein